MGISEDQLLLDLEPVTPADDARPRADGRPARRRPDRSERATKPDTPSDDAPAVEVRRSARRRRTVSAYRDGERTIVLIPARMSRAEEARWVEVMLRRLESQERRRRPSDAALTARARRLAADHLDGLAHPATVRWVTNQSSRWGSCTPGDASIRLSDRLQPMPSWVVDYVLVHELAHLIEASHSPRFWSLVSRYPRAERARGYLEGVAATAGPLVPVHHPAADPSVGDPSAGGSGADWPDWCLYEAGWNEAGRNEAGRNEAGRNEAGRNEAGLSEVGSA